MSMSDRERDFESKYAHDQELRFRIQARRNKLLGLWAAEKLGLTGGEADEYAQEVIKADFLLPGDEDVVDKIKTDFAKANVQESDKEIRQQMERMLIEAENQIRTS